MSDATKTDDEAKTGVTLVKVSAYRTSDGKLHDTRNEAIRAQAMIDLANWLESKGLPPGGADDLAMEMADAAAKLTKLLANVNKGR